tara:strand:- start:184 stop:354 length:171 start_codon:yes stop_codon:yes gene_type:complete
LQQENDFCGCGGTGRRAALRALWVKSRGSSILLGRTKNYGLNMNKTSLGLASILLI